MHMTTRITRILLKPKVRTTALTAAVATLFLVSLTSFPQLMAASTSGPTNSVQVSIQPSNVSLVTSYGLTAYNSSGWPVATYSGQYAQVTFQLPTGKYLFAANAFEKSSAQTSPSCVSPPPMVAGSAGNGAVAAGVPPVDSKMYPCYYNQQSEYGYSLVSISGSTSLNIATQLTSNVPTVNISVSVNYKNGTAVPDAYVYGNVVGGNWYLGDQAKVMMYAQTGKDGVAHLVVPAVPLTIMASKSVQIDIPKSTSTVQVNVGGQLVNVTIYYSPTYVYLTATGLLVPPQTSLNMVVTAQTGYPGPYYASGASISSGGPVGVVAPGQGSGAGAKTPATPASNSPPQQGAAADVLARNNGSSLAQIASIPPIPSDALVTPAATQTSSTSSAVSLVTLETIALAGAIATIVGLAIKMRR
jgi:hypothetical protein